MSHYSVDVVSGNINTQTTPASTLYMGKKTTNAGTAVALAAATTIKSVTLRSLNTNTGSVYVGDSTVSSANGYELLAGETIAIDIDDLSKVFIDVSVNGEGASYIAIN